MALEGITLGAWEFFAIIIGIPSIITIPVTAFLIRLKSKTEQHDRCIVRLENKIDNLAKQMDMLHRETKDDLKDIKGFFVDWIQRIEDVTRDRRPEGIPTFYPKKIQDIGTGEKVIVETTVPQKVQTQYQQDQQQNSIEDKIDKLEKLLNKLVDENKDG